MDDVGKCRAGHVDDGHRILEQGFILVLHRDGCVVAVDMHLILGGLSHVKTATKMSNAYLLDVLS